MEVGLAEWFFVGSRRAAEVSDRWGSAAINHSLPRPRAHVSRSSLALAGGEERSSVQAVLDA